MRLSEFLRTHADEILGCWDEFAATIAHQGLPLDNQALRDHAAQILQTIADDLDSPQTEAEQIAKSEGKSDSKESEPDTAAETHADTRIDSGVPVDAMITEYRALRASVLRLWSKYSDGSSYRDDLRDLNRFNEAVDQAITESVTRYSRNVKQSTDLFVGILGHDIRNPLGTISLSTQHLVRSGQLSAKAAEKILNSVARINSVIEHVVDFTRAQSHGVMPVNPQPGNLADQFYKVVEETRVRHPDRVLRLEPNGNFDGRWDEGRMGQLLSNLLENAMSYGARDVPVTISMWASPDEVSFSVHNGGKAIPKAEQARIFEPLARGQADGKEERRQPDGLGLGLYICQEIVRAHGGRISVESEDRKGTSFVVHLPRVAPGGTGPAASAL